MKGFFFSFFYSIPLIPTGLSLYYLNVYYHYQTRQVGGSVLFLLRFF